MHFPRVLVLGATGRIGGILRSCWAGRDGVRWQARGPGPGEGGGTGPADLPAAAGTWVACDPLRDAAGLARAAKGCAVILCLSGVTPARAATDPQADLAENTALALAAIRAAGQARARVLLASSAAVYGNQPGLLREDAPLLPANAYGQAKAGMEQRGADLGAELGVPVTRLRIGNIAGVDAILGGWRPGFRLDQFADGRTPRRSYIGPVTLARVLEALAAQPKLPPVLNLAEPGMVEMGALLRVAGLAHSLRPAPDTAIPEVELDVSALQRLCPALPAAGDPARMVAEWRGL